MDNNNNNNIVIIDLQGFKSNSNHFIVKELAIVFNINNNNNSNNNDYINFIIKPPFDFKCLSTQRQKEANWLTKNHHHINWNYGSATYQSVYKFLKSNTRHSKVFIKGEEKKKCLEEMIHQTVFNVKDIGCINFKQLENKYPKHIYCNYHTHGVCALKNAFLLSKEIKFLT